MNNHIFKNFLDFYRQPTKKAAEKYLADLQKQAKNKKLPNNAEQLVLMDKIQDAYIDFLQNNISPDFPPKERQLCHILAEKNICTPADIAQKIYEPLNIHRKYTTLLGTLALPLSLMISGKPGSGKTTFFLMLMKDLALKNPQKKILFIANEERQTPAMAQKIIRFGLERPPNIYFVEEQIKSWQLFDFVFVDSVNSLNISLNDFKQQIKNAEKHNIALFYIFQSTKTGAYKGPSGFEHEVAISLAAENGLVSVRKNRFGGNGTFKVFKPAATSNK